MEQRYEGSEVLTTLEKSILGSGETKGKGPYKRTGWMFVRSTKKSVCLEQGERVERSRASFI